MFFSRTNKGSQLYCNRIDFIYASHPSMYPSKEQIKLCLVKCSRRLSSHTQVKLVITECIGSLTTGSIEAYRKPHKARITDMSHRVESIFGFVEPYRHTVYFSISDPEEMRARLVNDSTRIHS
ncbi:hypothetical protein ARSEF1564_010135 [Beauveria bassiana]